jgi:hypothetical protein
LVIIGQAFLLRARCSPFREVEASAPARLAVFLGTFWR